MLFNSFIFIFIFLPVTLFFFHLAGKSGYKRIAIAWLVVASLFFYGWWNIYYLWLIIISIIFNYIVGVYLQKSINKKFILIFGIVANLALLLYYKYANFFVENLTIFFENQIFIENIALPLAISFFTFQQIGYLVDIKKGLKTNYSFLNYCIFVSFFPQLIAGPIVHHRQMVPQFIQDTIYKVRSKNLVIGFTIFTLGLFKKVLLADNAALYADPTFSLAETGIPISFFDAWLGVLAYSFQLYFDFSGYSDMAVGLARMFGIYLPINFNSPYKSTSIIEFWRRWHITLSSFLRDYLYIPLGGGRRGGGRKMLNIMITMVIGGMWHGAGWLFLLWGGIHGLYLVINHMWNIIVKNKMWAPVSWLITMLAVVVAWVPFRSEGLVGAVNIWSGMIGLNGFILPEIYINFLNNLNMFGEYLLSIGVQSGNTDYFIGSEGLVVLLLLFFITLLLPNTYQFMSKYHKRFFGVAERAPTQQRINIFFKWRPTFLWSIIISLLFALSVLDLFSVAEFIYFQF
jgi:alginate O-acetyltransferase complex protein AlgI